MTTTNPATLATLATLARNAVTTAAEWVNRPGVHTDARLTLDSARAYLEDGAYRSALHLATQARDKAVDDLTQR